MVDSAANILLQTLRDLLIEEVKFLSHVCDDVKKVEADLKTIHALLMEADANGSQADSPTLKTCIDELRELAFKAENILETHAFEVESKKGSGKSLKKKLQRFMCILCECSTVHEVGNEIDDIRSRLAQLTGKLSSISGGGESSSYSAQQEEMRKVRLTYSHEEDQHFVGMEKDIEDVVSLVEDDSTSVIAICGMGGLGKTTLARKIYNNRDVQGRFDRRAWVCVTQQFQAESILREIIQQIDGTKPDKDESHDELVRGLHDVLLHKKSLIVIDDIWETGHWEILKKAFPRENCKVVLTTRNEKIASHDCHLHKLRFLTEDEGWELLGKIAFSLGQGVLETEQFESIGRKMVRDCGCLPLAISVIGGILRGKQQLWAWEEVSRNMDIYLNNGGEGMGDDKRVKQVLDLSFDVLPYYLKPCFLYLASFPEDHDIDTERLYLLWLAEGFISSEEKGKNESLRDVAERCLTELALRCMVQVKKGEFITPFKKFASCRLHDLMRDLCSSKTEHEKFIKQVDISQHQQDISSTIGPPVRRLAINVVDDDDDVTLREICLHEVKDLRSLLILQKINFGIRTQSYLNAINPKNLKHLRILGLDGVSVENGKFISGFVKVIYLKYLSFFRCRLKLDDRLELPEDVCYLPFLQTIDLRVIYGMTLPNLIWKMKGLRHLFLPHFIDVIGGGKLRLVGLKELETLEGINSQHVHIADIINLTNLRTLSGIIRNEDVDILSKIVDFMTFQLREADLKYEGCDLKNVIEKIVMMRSLVGLEIGYEIGCSFPSYKQGMCQNLVKLEIRGVKIGIDAIEAFGKYPMLQYLYLHIVEFEEGMVEMRFAANSFLKLKVLGLFDLKDLHIWEVEKGAMPQLMELSIGKCENLDKIPDELRFLSTLNIVYIHQMPENFKSRLMNRGEDDGKFSHKPKFYFM